MFSGQTFRWTWKGEHLLQGVDGGFAYWVELSTPGLVRVESNGSAEDFRRLFRLEESLAELAAQIAGMGGELAPFVSRLSGLRVMRQSSAVETAITFLCTANNNMARIGPMVAYLAEMGDVLVEHRGRAVRRFPGLEVIAAREESELRSNGFGYRAASIPKAARAMVERGGSDWLDSLRFRPYDEAIAELTRIPGIGPKLADCIALFGLHHTEAVPVDTHVWQAACRLYFPEFAGKAVTGSRYRAVGDHFRARFGPLAGWAQQMLFYDNLEMGRVYRKAGE